MPTLCHGITLVGIAYRKTETLATSNRLATGTHISVFNLQWLRSIELYKQ